MDERTWETAALYLVEPPVRRMLALIALGWQGNDGIDVFSTFVLVYLYDLFADVFVVKHLVVMGARLLQSVILDLPFEIKQKPLLT